MSEVQVRNALDVLAEELAPGRRGLVLKEVGGGYTLATDPDAELAARRLLSRPKTPPLTQAQAETLAIVAYLQPVSRPEISRIRGVSSESAVTSLDRARPDRGVGALALRRDDLRDHASCSSGSSASPASTSSPTSPASTRRRRTLPSCASACSRRASSAARG